MTSRFCYRARDKKAIPTKIISVEERSKCLNKAKFLCSSNCFRQNLTPDDLFPQTSEPSFLAEFFKKISALYALCFLLDNTHINENNLAYKLNGFKSIAGEYNISDTIDDKTIAIINRIYSWGYKGGDIDDKILIIRNILSLNLDMESLYIHPNTFDAIISNYKIYQKENVRQYLDLRNNIVQDIKRYQDSIFNAIENFEDTFKKISITLLSFFFISLVLSILSFALSSTQHIPDAVILCCFGICIISMLYYYKEKVWLKERISHIENKFRVTQRYYEDLLGEEELKMFFEENDSVEDEDLRFRNKRIKEFSLLWILLTSVIGVILLTILILNHIHPLREIIHILKTIALHYPQ